MKKISLLKKLGLGLGTVATSIPLALCATACTSTTAIDVKFISFEKFNDNFSDNLQTGNFNADKLLLGSRDFFDGNYFLFVGSNTFDSTCKFFAADSKVKDTTKWYSEYLESSCWSIDNKAKAADSKVNKNFGFVSFIDDFDTKIYDEKGKQIFIVKEDAEKGPMQVVQYIGPYEKWTKEIIAETKYYNKNFAFHYEWDDESVDEGDYIRQDDQAKAYRELCSRGAVMFPTVDQKRTKTFDTADNNTTSLMVIYKDGKLQEIVDLPQKTNLDITLPADPHEYKDTDTLYGAINKYFLLDEEEEPEPEPTPPEPEPTK